MIYFLLGIIFAWLSVITWKLFYQKQITTENIQTWGEHTPTRVTRSITTGSIGSNETVVFIENDRVGEILKEKKDANLDDILI